MEEKTQQTTLIKVIALLATLILATLLIVGVVQTFIHNGLIAKNNELLAQNEQIEQAIDQTQEEIDIRNSNDYLDDYLEQEEGYGNEGDIIVIINNG